MRFFWRLTLAILAIATTLLASACNDRTSPRPPITGLATDTGIEADFSFDDPVRSLCVPGSQRCVAENSPMFERCGREGARYHSRSCGDSEVCREGECVPFSCVPGRALCVGAATQAVCDSTGLALERPTDCEGAEVCRGGVCRDPCEDARESRSYIACEYTAHDLPNLYKELAERRAPFAVVVANPARLVSATVTIRDGPDVANLVEPFLLEPGPANSLGTPTEQESQLLLPDGTTKPFDDAGGVEVPAGAAAVFLLEGSGSYDIESSRPVVAYQFSPYCCNFTATNDASLLLPTSTWGTRYRVLGYPAWLIDGNEDFLQAYVSIVSAVDTTVTIRSPVEVREAGAFDTFTEKTIALDAGRPRVVETAVDSSAELEDPATDLTGMVIESEDPFAVFTGHPCTFVPQDQWACDHLEEAVLPSTVLGSRYVLTPARRRALARHDADPDRDVREATYWRILADEPARVTFDPPLAELEVLGPSNASTTDCRDLLEDEELVLEAGEFCEFGTSDPTTANSTGALIVGGVISGHQSTGVNIYGTQAGDPSLFILPPVEQFRSDYAFVTAPTFKRGYVTIAAPPSAAIALDGRAIPQDQRLERLVVDLGDGRWEVFTIAVEAGVHSLQSENQFGIVVYAYDDYVSYAFTGGLDLLPKGLRGE